jgi:hypothetical protein
MNRTAMMFLMWGLLASPKVFAAPEEQPKAAPLTSQEIEAIVRRSLSGYEPLNAQRDLQALAAQSSSAAVAGVLIHILRDTNPPGILRLSAIEALGYVPTLFGKGYLHNLVSQLADPAIVDDDRSFTLAAAVRALGSFSVSEESRLLPYLQHGSADVREAAAQSLVRCGAPPDEVIPLLQKRLALESDRGVKAALLNAMAALQRQSH